MTYLYHLYFEHGPRSREPIHGIATTEDPYNLMAWTVEEHFPKGLPNDCLVRLVVVPFAPPRGGEGLYRDADPEGEDTVELYLNPELADRLLPRVARAI